MSWKQREYLDMLLYAPEGDDGGDDGDQAGGGGDGEAKTSPEIAALQSKYDKEVAELREKLTALESEKDTDSKTATQQRAYDAVVAEVQDRLRELQADDDTDPKALAKKAHDIILDLGTKYATQRSLSVKVQGQYKETLAKSLAMEIVSEHGGSTATYQARLLKASTEEAMAASAELIKAEVMKENFKANPNQKSNGRTVDNGRGSAVRTDVLREMNDIDVTTPEGKQKWEENRERFRKTVQAGRA